MNLRRVLRQPARMLASGLPLPVWMRRTGQFLLLPLYHVVADTPPPHIRHLYPVRTRAQFQRDLAFLLDHAAPLRVANFLEQVAAGKPFTEPCFLLTFDDGLRECHEVVTPILEELGLEAISFLNPAFVGNSDLFYRYMVSLLIERLAAQHITMEDAAADIAAVTGRKPADVRQFLLSVEYTEREWLVTLAQRWGLDIPGWLRDHRPYLDLEQLRDMSARGWTFGAHSMDHPMYRQLPPEEQKAQTRQSLHEIRYPGVNSRNVFAFPFTDDGVSGTFMRWMYDELGVAAGFGCAGMHREAFPRHFQRLPFEKTTWDAADILRTEYLHYSLKVLLGRGAIRREG